jgi:hypothetical protein
VEGRSLRRYAGSAAELMTLGEEPTDLRGPECLALWEAGHMAERAQRPTVLGREIHLGSGSEFGTRVSTAMYCLVQSARRVGVAPADDLRAVVKVTPSDPRRQAVLLPHAFAAQEHEADAAS